MTIERRALLRGAAAAAIAAAAGRSWIRLALADGPAALRVAAPTVEPVPGLGLEHRLAEEGLVVSDPLWLGAPPGTGELRLLVRGVRPELVLPSAERIRIDGSRAENSAWLVSVPVRGVAGSRTPRPDVTVRTNAFGVPLTEVTAVPPDPVAVRLELAVDGAIVAQREALID